MTNQYRDAHLEVDFETRRVKVDGEELPFTRMEFELLARLLRDAGFVVHRGDLLREVWGYSMEARTRTLDVHVRRLRRKLGPHADRYIETIFGIGYRFQPGGLHHPVVYAAA